MTLPPVSQHSHRARRGPRMQTTPVVGETVKGSVTTFSFHIASVNSSVSHGILWNAGFVRVEAFSVLVPALSLALETVLGT